MGSVVVGPQTAQRLLDIHAPHILLDEVGTGEVILNTGAKLIKCDPSHSNLLHRYGDRAYLVSGEAYDGEDIRTLGLEPDPNIIF